MGAIQLVVFFIAVWRLTVLFLQDTGPFGFIDKFRDRVGADVNYEDAGELGRLFQCPYCFSVWAAIGLYAAVMVFPNIFWPVAYILAASGAAIFIEEFR